MTAPGADPALLSLLTPEAVRERCEEMWHLGVRGTLPHFAVAPRALDIAVERVVDETRRNYPDLRVPAHSRWRHLELAGRDLWREAWSRHGTGDARARARSRFDLAVVSVLLDAGAGPHWRFRDAATGLTLGRSEGLALASLRLMESGVLSVAGTGEPLRCDSARLRAVDAPCLARVLQAGPDNPLAGLEGRAALLQRLGAVLEERADVFSRGGQSRVGHLYDHLRERAGPDLPAREILVALLTELGGIWPRSRDTGALRAGDVGKHPAIRRADPSDGLVPFHKLSQWLAYSLMEPLEEAGVRVTHPDALTGLAEYRNGGLLVDCGVLSLRNEAEGERTQDPAGSLVVEWRALTVAALDLIALGVRERLGLDAARLPLASVLQGGTWSAGRRIAVELRPGGPPPIAVASDGTLF